MQLSETLAEEGARLLTSVIAKRKFVEPIEPLVPLAHEDFVYLTGGQGLSKARKLKKEDSTVDWEKDGIDIVLRKLRVFGRVWDKTGAGVLPDSKKGATRVFYNGAKELDDEEAEALRELWRNESAREPVVGRAFLFSLGQPKSTMRVGINLSDGRVLEILSCAAGGRPHEKKSETGGYGIGLISGWIQNKENSSKE
jgi:hypothetical protein